MSSTIHEIDPDGDVVLILRSYSAPFAVWDESVDPLVAPVSDPHDLLWMTWVGMQSKDRKRNKEKRRFSSFGSLDPGFGPEILPFEEPTPVFEDAPAEEPVLVLEDAPAEEPALVLEDEPFPEEVPDPEDEPFPEEVPDPEYAPTLGGTTADKAPSDSRPEGFPSEEEVDVRIQLSSKHLTLASMYFKKMLQGPWKESIMLPNSSRMIDAFKWDVEAMLILMNIIHGRVRSVPRIISLEMFAKLAVLVDYYVCHEVVMLFVEVWVQNLKVIPKEYCRDLILWLVVSWVFSLETHFEIVTKVALEKSDEPIQTLNLPIPQHIVESVDQQRQECLKQIVSGLHHLVSYFSGQDNCSFECSSVLLGALVKQMRSNNLFNPKPTRPYLRYSVSRTITTIRDFRSPQRCSSKGSYSIAHSCNLAAFTDPIVSGFVDGMKGLNLKDFKS